MLIEENWAYHSEKMYRLREQLELDLKQYMASGNAKELFVKKQEKIIHLIAEFHQNSYDIINYLIQLINDSDHIHRENANLKRQLANLQQKYTKLKKYAQVHGIDTDLVENYVSLRDFY